MRPDPNPQNDTDGDGKPDDASQLMDPYPDAGEALIDALTNKRLAVDKLPYTDKWDTFYSAYAPFYDCSGQFVGTLGMDLPPQEMQRVQRIGDYVRDSNRRMFFG